MCTLSQWRDADHYGILFNRDEKKTRPRAEQPALREGSFLAPRDPEGGGTWLAVNRNGLIIALLNRWQEKQSGTASRGRLVWALAKADCVASLEAMQEATDFSPYPGFTLFAMDDSREIRWEWNTVSLSKSKAASLMTSSSYEPDKVASHRTLLYRKNVNPADMTTLDAFHNHSSDGAFSPRMLRDDAQTWSRSRITVIPREIRWSYLEEFMDFSRPPKEWQTSLDRISANSLE